MPKLTKLTIATTTFLLAIAPAVFAQDDTGEVISRGQIVDSFASADIDADGALDRNEFVSFVIMKSDKGDADYKSVKISGEYDNHFNTKDYNADGLLTVDELKAPISEKPHVISEEKAPVDEPG